MQFKFPHLTPYNYASNSPITHLDIDGMQNPEETDPLDQKPLCLNPEQKDWSKIQSQIESKFKSTIINGLLNEINNENNFADLHTAKEKLEENIQVTFDTDFDLNVYVNKEGLKLTMEYGPEDKTLTAKDRIDLGKEKMAEKAEEELRDNGIKYFFPKLSKGLKLISPVLQVVEKVVEHQDMGDGNIQLMRKVEGESAAVDIMKGLRDGKSELIGRIDSAKSYAMNGFNLTKNQINRLKQQKSIDEVRRITLKQKGYEIIN